MTNKYLRSVGYQLVSCESLEPLLPFLQMDCMYQIYCKDIKPLELRHEMKQLRKRWIDTYNIFNRRFFCAFTQEEQYEVVDKMDEFETYIANDVMIAKVQVMNVLSDLETNQAIVCSSLILCNVLCQAAGIIWKHVYKTRSGSDATNLHIDACERLTTRLMNLYHSAVSNRIVNPNQSKAITTSIDALCKRMVQWLTVNEMKTDKE